MENKSEKTEVDEKLLDEIANEIVKTEVDEKLLDEIANEIVKKIAYPPKQESGDENSGKPNSMKFGKLHADSVYSRQLAFRLEDLENKVDNFLNDYKIAIAEMEKLLIGKFEEFSDQREKQLLYLQGQVENLRTAMIKLGNEFKRIKENGGNSI